MPLIGCSMWDIWFNQSEALPRHWVVMSHQYGVSALVSQTSVSSETSGSVTKCPLFSQASLETESFRMAVPLRTSK